MLQHGKKRKSISERSLSCDEKGIYTREKLIKKKKNALILYWSKTGNTEKVANAIKKGLEEMSIKVLVERPEEADNVDYFDYELVCIGAPSYSVGKYIRRFFEHLGFNVLDEWYILSEFHGSLENSVKGKMGDIRGKPTSEDLEKVRENTKRVANLL